KIGGPAFDGAQGGADDPAHGGIAPLGTELEVSAEGFEGPLGFAFGRSKRLTSRRCALAQQGVRSWRLRVLRGRLGCGYVHNPFLYSCTRLHVAVWVCGGKGVCRIFVV